MKPSMYEIVTYEHVYTSFHFAGHYPWKLMADQGDDWEKYLDVAVFATNTSVQCTTKVTPFYMMFGRESRFPLEAEKHISIPNLKR